MRWPIATPGDSPGEDFGQTAAGKRSVCMLGPQDPAVA